VFAVPHGDGVEIHTLTWTRAGTARAGRGSAAEAQIRLVPAVHRRRHRGRRDLRVAAALLAARTGRPVKAVDGSVGHWPAGTAEPAGGCTRSM